MVKLPQLLGEGKGAGHTHLPSQADAWPRAAVGEAPPPGPGPAHRGRVVGCISEEMGSWGRSQRLLGPPGERGEGSWLPGGASCPRNEESWEQVMKPQPGLREAACPAGLAPTCLSLLLSLFTLGCGSLCNPVAHRREQVESWTRSDTQGF